MRAFAIGILCAGLAACDSPNFRTSQFRFGDTDTLAATGNLRFVTERPRSIAGGPPEIIMCSEPTPDYATAFSQDVDLTLKSTAAQAPAEGTLGNAVTEKIENLGGRSKGVLALRDGLYAACQAYTNGQIGKDAYSMILSQYGTLLVALMNETAPTATVQGGNGAANAEAIRVQRAASAFSAVLVACINGNDPTRQTAEDLPPNPLLTREFCRNVVARAGGVTWRRNRG
ncbi:hypothetical protein [Enterovirga aerilata]|uniref:Lipoprotein n=1 Tax=Enterovirga aerilata TaxID=2730920 RepID=A0A849I3U2_9HYPH|nr:hypothetical protein [Enterovirga sp. DB1703]NNM71035.1 hypothetical protein [Enterovirga sp. DB1703]